VERGICPIAELYLLRLTVVSSQQSLLTYLLTYFKHPALNHHHLGHVTSSVT